MTTVEKVIDLGAFRTKLRHGGRWEKTHCPHLHVTVDKDGGVIDCDDCKKPVSAFHIIVSWCQHWAEIAEAVTVQKVRAAEMRKMLGGYKVRLRALKELETRWWHKGMLPCCPHCNRGLLAEDFANGPQSMVGREYEMARRKRPAQPPAPRGDDDAIS